LALARFSLVSRVQELLARQVPLKTALETVVSSSAPAGPEGAGPPVAVRTLEDWWYAHQRGGFAALHPKARSDRGVPRKLSPEHEHLIVAQARLHPAISIKVLYRQWKQAHPTLPGLYTIYRALQRHDLNQRSRHYLVRQSISGPTKAFEAPLVNDLWMVDFSPGPTLSVHGQARSTQLCVLVDDHSRLIPFAAYYPQADTEAFHHAFKEAVLRRGLPRKLYTDNGKPFINAHSHLVCAQLGVRLLHCKPYHSWSKGKCERLIQSIQQGFETTLRIAGNAAGSLEELNAKLSVWIQTVYHQRTHSSTGQSPEYRYQQAAKTLRRWDPSIDIEPLFYLRLERTVRKNGTIRLDGQLYEVPLSLRALKVQLRLDPWRRTRIEVWYQNQFKGLARKAPLHLNAENGGSQAYDR
jgi:transposase InsO family protein